MAPFIALMAAVARHPSLCQISQSRKASRRTRAEGQRLRAGIAGYATHGEPWRCLLPAAERSGRDEGNRGGRARRQRDPQRRGNHGGRARRENHRRQRRRSPWQW
ncbi:hypothetical protein BRADI_4g22155v3 [Brachypodium distachyon]|uniref:Uncharacterized protein n=1 Tax=Brachypodium distachyon TaxID=15368 RepID=A0A0Q3ERL5_BRADI|nr:hypothetical protein BRADI_4g22155v3 [Brachypodium distachyon]